MVRRISFGSTAKKKRLIHTNVSYFYDRLQELQGYNAAMCINLFKWVNKDDAKSLFSVALANKAKLAVKQAIMSGGSSIGVNWKDNANKDYGIWKDKHYGHTNPWRMSGKVLQNIVARKSSNGWDVGITERNQVPRIQFGLRPKEGKWIKGSGNPIDIGRYASYIEFGTHYTKGVARPLFAPSFLQVIQKDFPDLVRIVEKSIKMSVDKLAPKKEVANIDNVMSQGSRDQARGMDEGSGGSARLHETMINQAYEGKNPAKDKLNPENEGKLQYINKQDENALNEFLQADESVDKIAGATKDDLAKAYKKWEHIL